MSEWARVRLPVVHPNLRMGFLPLTFPKLPEQNYIHPLFRSSGRDSWLFPAVSTLDCRCHLVSLSWILPAAFREIIQNLISYAVEVYLYRNLTESKDTFTLPISSNNTFREVRSRWRIERLWRCRRPTARSVAIFVTSAVLNRVPDLCSKSYKLPPGMYYS